MPHSALFIVDEKDAPTQAEVIGWRKQVAELRDIVSRTPSASSLGENALLLPLAAGLHSLAEATRIAKSYGFQSRVLFFDQPPAWVVSPP